MKIYCNGKELSLRYFNHDEYTTSTTKQYRDKDGDLVAYQSYYLGHPMDVYNDSGSRLFRIWPQYAQCCGMREIGWLNEGCMSEVKEAMLQLVKVGFPLIGCLTYTEVFYGDMDFPLYPEVTEMLERWEGVSYGALWYNPNSGNMVRQVTLPVNQDKKSSSSNEENEDEDEDN